MVKRIAITRPKERSKAAKEFIENYGGEAVIVPTLELKLENTDSLKELMGRFGELDWFFSQFNRFNIQVLSGLCSNFKS